MPKGSTHATGWDIYAPVNMTLQLSATTNYSLHIAIKCPEFIYPQKQSRSGFTTKNHLH